MGNCAAYERLIFERNGSWVFGGDSTTTSDYLDYMKKQPEETVEAYKNTILLSTSKPGLDYDTQYLAAASSPWSSVGRLPFKDKGLTGLTGSYWTQSNQLNVRATTGQSPIFNLNKDA